MSKKCIKCGTMLEDDALFCSECGEKQKPVEKKCQKCGTVLIEGAKFCMNCGTPVATATAATPQPSPQLHSKNQESADFDCFLPSMFRLMAVSFRSPMTRMRP